MCHSSTCLCEPIPWPTTWPVEQSQNPKTPEGNRKPSLALIPGPALVEQAIVHKLGADKYGAYNWREQPKIETMVYLNAALRHLHAFIDGQDIDEESGVTHLAHVCACCNIIIDAKAVGNLFNDRPHHAPTAEMLQHFSKKKGDTDAPE